MALTNAERQKLYRARKQGGQATGEKPPATKPEAFTGPQLEILRAVIREELTSLLEARTPSPTKPRKPASANDDAIRFCPVCGGHVTGGPLKVYCSTPCRKAANRGAQECNHAALMRFDECWAAWPTGHRHNIGEARAAWAKRGLDSVAGDVIRHLERLKRDPEWIPPLAATFLNNLRFVGAKS